MSMINVGGELLAHVESTSNTGKELLAVSMVIYYEDDEYDKQFSLPVGFSNDDLLQFYKVLAAHAYIPGQLEFERIHGTVFFTDGSFSDRYWDEETWVEYWDHHPREEPPTKLELGVALDSYVDEPSEEDKD